MVLASEAGVLDMGGEEARPVLVDLVQEAEGLGVVGELGGGHGLGQHALGLGDGGIGGGNRRQGGRDGVGVRRGEIGIREQVPGGGAVGGRLRSGWPARLVAGDGLGARQDDDGSRRGGGGCCAGNRLSFRFAFGPVFFGVAFVLELAQGPSLRR